MKIPDKTPLIGGVYVKSPFNARTQADRQARAAGQLAPRTPADGDGSGVKATLRAARDKATGTKLGALLLPHIGSKLPELGAQAQPPTQAQPQAPPQPQLQKQPQRLARPRLPRQLQAPIRPGALSPGSTRFLDDLPDELLLNIIAHMDVPDRSRFRATSRHNKALATEFVLDAWLRPGDDPAELLAAYPKLESFTASNCNLVANDAHALASHPSLRVVDVRRNNSMDDQSVQIMATSPRLEILYMSGNPLGTTPGTPGLHALAANPRIKQLHLTFSNIGDAGAQALAASTSITSLNLGANNIGDAGAQALAANTSITSLDLRINDIGDEGALALAANTSITSLDLRGNNLGPAGLAALEAVRDRFQTLRL